MSTVNKPLHPTPEWNLYKTKKVWSCSFICTVALDSLASINNTPHLLLYTLDQYMTIQVMNGLAYPDAVKLSRFPYRDKSETLSSKYVILSIIGQHCKDRKFLHSLGCCSQFSALFAVKFQPYLLENQD